MGKLPRWVEVWGPVVLVLGAMWTMTSRLEDRLSARIEGVESRLTARIEGVESRLTVRIEGVESRLTVRIAENRSSIQRVESKVDELSGYVRGLHGMDLAEGKDR